MSELKPCPFCRFTAHTKNRSKEYYQRCTPAIIEIKSPWHSKSDYAVQCQNCSTIGPLGDNDDEASLYWNEQQWEEVLENCVDGG